MRKDMVQSAAAGLSHERDAILQGSAVSEVCNC